MTKKHIFTAAAMFLSGWITPCGDWGDYYDIPARGYFEQAVIGDTSLFQFLRPNADFLNFYYASYQFKDSTPDYNLREWQQYWGGKPDIQDVSAVVYGIASEDMPAVLKNAKKGKVWAEMSDNTALLHCAQNKDLAALEYLAFAKECEAYYNSGYYDWENYTYVEPLPLEAEKYVSRATAAMNKTANKDLKLRYAFQIVRLYFYSAQYEEVVSAFDRYVEPWGKKTSADYSYMYYRAMEYKAGAHHRLYRADAARFFAQVFNNCPDRRLQVLCSFRELDKALLESGLESCQTADEKAAFYTMRGLAKTGLPVEELENIAKIAPNSKYLELLMARQISFHENNTQSPKADLLRLQMVCQQLAANAEVKNRDLWHCANSFIYLLIDNHNECRKTAALVPAASPYFRQAQIIDFVSALKTLDKLNETLETAFYQRLERQPFLLKNKSVERLFWNTFASLYRKNDQQAKSLLCLNSYHQIQYHLDVAAIDALILFKQQKAHVGIEKTLYERSMLNEADALHFLVEAKGTYYMRHNQFEQAIKQFETLPESYRKTSKTFSNDNIKPSIFSLTFKSGYTDPQMDSGVEFFADIIPEVKGVSDKMSLAKAMLSLEQTAQSQPDKAAIYYLALAAAWLNISPDGWYDEAIDYTGHKTPYINYSSETGTNMPSDFNAFYSYYNGQLPLDYLEKAMKATNDRELQAKIAFAAARAENYNFFASLPANYLYLNSTPRIGYRPSHQKYFYRLRHEFSDTRYFQEAIAECFYFREYVQ